MVFDVAVVVLVLYVMGLVGCLGVICVLDVGLSLFMCFFSFLQSISKNDNGGKQVRDFIEAKSYFQF